MVYQGLTDNEVQDRINKFGENSIPKDDKIKAFKIFFNQFKSPLIYILIVTSIISFLLQELIDGSLMLAVILLNVLMGFFQEYKAQRTLQALSKIIQPFAFVIRNNLRQKIEARNLVPDDLVLVSAGDKIPADGVMIESYSLLVNEAILTGENESLEKTKNDLVLMGTTVIGGKGIMKVITIGKNTEIGKISESLTLIKEEKTPLQIKLEKFSIKLTYIIITICLFIFIFGIISHQDTWYMLRVSIILTIAAIPESLPIAITVILSLGMKRVLKKNGLIKNLLTMETLGVTSVICTDKTGTLTEGKMSVIKTDFIDNLKACLALALTNDQKSEMEIAIWNYLKNSSEINPLNILKEAQKIIDEPFDSEKKYSYSLCKYNNKEQAIVVGAPEILIGFCSINNNDKAIITNKLESWADQGLRILGIIIKENGNLQEKSNFSWLGLVGIEDPIRNGVKEAIQEAQEAGIQVKIVTGDYRRTAEKVAFNLGYNLKKNSVLEGKDLENITLEELQSQINNIDLFTRVTPHQKLKIIEALQANKETVAMTGDGVNDALALKKADIGIAVSNATEVARDAADLILLDNNFQTILYACREGRLIFSNIKKVVAYVLSNSFAEIVLTFASFLMKLPMPLLVVQILWIHLICDGPPDIVLGFEKRRRSLISDNPKKLKFESILNNSVLFLIAFISLFLGLSSIFAFKYFMQTTNNLNLARTIAFAIISSTSLIYIFAYRDLNKLIIHMDGFLKNKYLYLSVIYGFTLVFIAIYVPKLNSVLELTPLSFYHWLLVIVIAIISIAVVELVKYLNIRSQKANLKDVLQLSE